MIIAGILFIIIGLLNVLFHGKMFKLRHLGGEPSEIAKFFYGLRGLTFVVGGIILIIAGLR